MSEFDYAEALRLIRKHMQPGDTVGKMFMRAASAVNDSSERIDLAETALRRIVSLEEKNVPKYAQKIAVEALAHLSVRSPTGRFRLSNHRSK